LNIILIGFRGTSKTTIGKMLAQRLGKEFVDADEYLERKEGKTIKDIFAEGGEKLFREIETHVIAELCLLDNRVVATGGGAILREENVLAIAGHACISNISCQVKNYWLFEIIRQGRACKFIICHKSACCIDFF